MILSGVISLWKMATRKKVLTAIPPSKLQGLWMVYYFDGWSKVESQSWDIALNNSVTIQITTENLPSYSAPTSITKQGWLEGNRICFSRREYWTILEVTDQYIILSEKKVLFRPGQQRISKDKVSSQSKVFLLDRG